MKFYQWLCQTSSGYNFTMLPIKILLKLVSVAVLKELEYNLSIVSVDWTFTNANNIFKDLLLLLGFNFSFCAVINHLLHTLSYWRKSIVNRKREALTL